MRQTGYCFICEIMANGAFFVGVGGIKSMNSNKQVKTVIPLPSNLRVGPLISTEVLSMLYMNYIWTMIGLRYCPPVRGVDTVVIKSVLSTLSKAIYNHRGSVINQAISDKTLTSKLYIYL